MKAHQKPLDMTQLYSRTGGTLALLALLLAVSGCIVVVDDGGGGRGHGLSGTTWYLGVVWVGGHGYRSSNQDYGISFRTEDELSGTAGCASFTADYDASESSIAINRFRTSTFGCGDDEVRTAFLENLPAVDDMILEGSTLQLTTRSGATIELHK
ncbi:MAG: heat shock protein HslJ [Rhodothermales bacterium]